MSVLSNDWYPSRPPQKTNPCPPSASVASIAFFTCAAAKANTPASGLVAAPCMYLGCLNSCAVPHSVRMPVSSCSRLATSTMASRFALVSRSEPPSGAMSRSCQHQYSTPSRFAMSKKTCSRTTAWDSAGVPGNSHGRRTVGAPNMSLPSPRIVCQNASENFSQSFIFRQSRSPAPPPSAPPRCAAFGTHTSRWASKYLNASGLVLAGPSNGIPAAGTPRPVR